MNMELKPLALFGIISTSLSLSVISASLFKHRGLFFPAASELVASGLNLVILYSTFVYTLFVTSYLAVYLLFGQLRTLEIEQIYERAWFSLMDTFIALTIFRDGFGVSLVVSLSFLLTAKVFHWIVMDRVDAMDQTDELDFKFHARMVPTMLACFAIDIAVVYSAYSYTLVHGASAMIFYGFEYALLSIAVIGSFVKYVIQTLDRANDRQWDEKPTFLFLLDLVTGYLDFIQIS